MIIICDIDGTIADLQHRIHHFKSKPVDWDAFYADCHLDTPIEPVRQILLRLMGKDGGVMYVTGRREEVRKVTTEWLRKHKFPEGALWMRRVGDHREDFEVKRQMLDDLPAYMSKSDILCVLEDRDQVVKMWREEGLTCLQVRDGNY